MSMNANLAAQLHRLSPREKALIADHLWREAEAKLDPTPAQIAALDERATKALRHPSRLKPVGDAILRLQR